MPRNLARAPTLYGGERVEKSNRKTTGWIVAAQITPHRHHPQGAPMGV